MVRSSLETQPVKQATWSALAVAGRVISKWNRQLLSLAGYLAGGGGLLIGKPNLETGISHGYNEREDMR